MILQPLCVECHIIFNLVVIKIPALGAALICVPSGEGSAGANRLLGTCHQTALLHLLILDLAVAAGLEVNRLSAQQQEEQEQKQQTKQAQPQQPPQAAAGAVSIRLRRVACGPPAALIAQVSSHRWRRWRARWRRRF